MTARGLALRVLLGLVIVCGCSRRERPCEADPSGAPVDPALLAFLSRARAAHHMADAQEDAHPDRALSTLRTVIEGPLPGKADARPPEVREVLADTGARIADLESRAQKYDEAVQSIDRALLWVPEMNYFRGHLYEVLGLVEERRAHSLAQSGNGAGAEVAKSRALTAFERSMGIQAEVIRSLSADAGKNDVK